MPQPPLLSYSQCVQIPEVPFSYRLLLTPLHSFCVPSMISSTCHFKCFKPFYITLLQCPCFTSIQYLLCAFSTEGRWIHTRSFFLNERFLSYCNATFYFSFTSAIIGHDTSEVAELLCVPCSNSLSLANIFNRLPFLPGVRMTLVFFAFIRMLYFSDVCRSASIMR